MIRLFRRNRVVKRTDHKHSVELEFSNGDIAHIHPTNQGRLWGWDYGDGAGWLLTSSGFYLSKRLAVRGAKRYGKQFDSSWE